ncbi:TPA: hypothetical protein ACV4T7_000492 [Burkholderia ambifaria]
MDRLTMLAVEEIISRGCDQKNLNSQAFRRKSSKKSDAWMFCIHPGPAGPVTGAGGKTTASRLQANTLRGCSMSRSELAIGHGGFTPRRHPDEHGDRLNIESPTEPAIMKETGPFRGPDDSNPPQAIHRTRVSAMN